MTVLTYDVASSRRLAWERRRRSAATNWRLFRRNRQAMVGLAILVVCVVVAKLFPDLM